MKKLDEYVNKISKAQKSFESNSTARGAVGKNISALSEQIKAVNSSIKEVRSISMQVKILALNAAVEGTRAGDAGRSFSVVASEINKLSQITDTTVKKIEEDMVYMQRLLDNTVSDMAKAKDLGAEFEKQLIQCVEEAHNLSLQFSKDD